MAPPRGAVVQYREYGGLWLLIPGAALILILLLLLCSFRPRSKRRSVNLSQRGNSNQELHLTKAVKRGTSKTPETPDSQNGGVAKDPGPSSGKKAENNGKNNNGASVKIQKNIPNQNSEAETKMQSLRERNLPSIPQDNVAAKSEEPLYDTVNENEPPVTIINGAGRSNGSATNEEATGKTTTVPLYSSVQKGNGSLKQHQNQELLYEEITQEPEPVADPEPAHENKGPGIASQESNSMRDNETSSQTQENTPSADQMPNLTGRHLPSIPQDVGLEKTNIADPLYDTVNEIHDATAVEELRMEPPMFHLQVPSIEIEPVGIIPGQNGDNKSDGSTDKGEEKKIGVDSLYSKVCKKTSPKKPSHQESLEDETKQDDDAKASFSASSSNLNSSQTSLDMVSMAYLRAKKRGKDDISINSEREEPPPLPEKQFDEEDENQ